VFLSQMSLQSFSNGVLKSQVIYEKRVVFCLVLVTCLALLAAAPEENGGRQPGSSWSGKQDWR
jgi:hypothetical protein